MTTTSPIKVLRVKEPDRRWEQILATVPALWREGVYRLDRSPFDEVFVRNGNYLRSTKDYTFAPSASPRMAQEVAWWVWTCWAEGTRKVDPAMLRWWQRAIDALAESSAFTNPNTSVADFRPGLVVREALRQFNDRHGRLPSPGNTRNLESVAHNIHQLVSIRTTSSPWWAADTWNLALDNRIPRRPHEPAADRAVNIGAINPVWLREGVRFWLSER